MCITATVALLLASTAVSTGVALYGADTQAKQAEANAKFGAAQAEADARAAQGEAQIEADRIRKAGKAQQAQAVAAAAASGVDVNSPTALKLDEEIGKSAEEDAVLTILGGGDRASRMRQQAAADRIAGSNARTAGRVNQASTLLSSAAVMTNYGKGWKKAAGGGY